jgi:hypothetical protein
MGKRIERFFSNTILENIIKIEGNPAVVVLKNNLSYKGKILKHENNLLFLEVNTNKFLTFPIEEIQEIQIDKISLW